MTKLTPVRAPSGYDPTREEFPLNGPSCSRFLLMGFFFVVAGVLALYFVMSRRPASAAPALPTLAQFPTNTLTKAPTATDARTATVRAWLTNLPPMPTLTYTFTPSMTFTASPGPSPTRTDTPTRTPSRTPKPSPSRRPRPAAPPLPAPPQGDAIQPEPVQGTPVQVYRVITVWAPPVRATCCKPLEPMYTWTPTATIPITASPSPTPSQIPASATLIPTQTPIPATATALPSNTPMPSPTAIPATATHLPSPTITPTHGETKS